MTASTSACSGTIASVVMSPALPRSSSKAARTIGSMISRSVIARLRSAEFQHALDRAARPRSDCGLDGNLMSHGLERVADLRQRNALHMRAQIAGPHKFEIGVLHRDIVAHRAFGQQNHASWPFLAHVVGHGC